MPQRHRTAAGPSGPGSRHVRRNGWSVVVRRAWWLLLPPQAIAAWSSARQRGAARVLGYAVAGFVLLIGVAACSSEPAETPAALSSPSATSVPVAAPSAVPTSVPATTPRTGAGTPAAAAIASAPPAHVPAPRALAPTRRAPVHRPAAPTPRPAPAPTRGTGAVAGTYTNSAGHQVERPDGNAAGATAVCKDGTDSHSQSRSGTCSGHGGVARWL